jgi:hypothetical protein
MPDTHRSYKSIHPLVWCFVGAGIIAVASVVGAILLGLEFEKGEDFHPHVVAAAPAVGLEERAKSAAAVVVRAYVRGDFKTYVEYLPDDVVNQLGGPEKAASVLQKLMKGRGVVIHSLNVDEVNSIARDKETCIAVFPTITEMEINGTPARLEGFLLGISHDAGATWRFQEGSSAVIAETKQTYPKLSTTLTFPERRQRIGDPSKGDVVIQTREVNGRWTPDDETHSQLEGILKKARSATKAAK